MGKGLLCVSLAAGDPASCAAQVAQVADQADAVEIRLDLMKDPDVEACCRLLDLPLLFTNRPTWEGGESALSEEVRIAPLCDAARLGAAWVDCELRAPEAQRRTLQEATAATSTRLVLSWHDFTRTPDRQTLEATVQRMRDCGADIGKVVTTAHDPSDVLRVLGLLEYAAALDFPLSAFCMGEAGRISRFATLFLGGYMSYAAIDEARATAPGQFSLTHLHQLCTLYTAHGH